MAMSIRELPLILICHEFFNKITQNCAFELIVKYQSVALSFSRTTLTRTSSWSIPMFLGVLDPWLGNVSCVQIGKWLVIGFSGQLTAGSMSWWEGVIWKLSFWLFIIERGSFVQVFIMYCEGTDERNLHQRPGRSAMNGVCISLAEWFQAVLFAW